ncbi:MAG: pitrilysin family protein [Bacteroidales bacterium]|nr:pitrilysin family protein [Bacteroidales bacterium]MDT8373097.1 pitrilysin family protein [Bacteroidales bacterium]
MKNLSRALMILALISMTSCQNKTGDALNLPFEKYQLENGLSVILHQDRSDPIVSVAIYYHVGSNREVPGRTGFAHLFEHMMFQQSENVPEDQYFRLIQSAGGTLNGSTNQDRTNYYETVPKNALELVLWLESDRMGYLANTITQQAFAIQQNVVQNEKRQNYDNRPYGHSSTVMARALFPEGHPYSWTTIGEMKDLFNATVEDVKEFHGRFYIPNNATLSIAGDFETEEVKALVRKYFGEIPAGAEVEKLKPMPVTLAETKKLYHEDNFANTAQYTMAFPSAEMYNPDAYALTILSDILAGGKKSPMYNVLVKEKKLTSNVGAYNRAQLLAGTFQIFVNANPGVSLTEVENAIFEAFERFESEGFTEKDLEKVKAGQETRFYNMISSVDGKSKQLAEYNMYAGDPGFYKKDMEAMKAVTMDDVQRVYEKYIKSRNYVATSFVPRSKVELAAEGSVDAGIEEENILTAIEVKIEEGAAEEIQKTPTSFDRSVQPPLGPDVSVTVPTVWRSSLANGMQLFGIEHSEVPLVQYNIVIEGGHMLDGISAPGVANMLAMMLNEGTKNKTPVELEEEIDLLGAMIRVSANDESITVSVNTLTRNFEKTLAIVEEMLLEPRWDSLAFEISRTRVLNNLRRSSIDPTYLGSRALARLTLGEGNIFATDVSGTVESVQSMTMEDLKAFYEKNISPSVARFLVVGSVDQAGVEKALARLGTNWSAKEVQIPEITYAQAPDKAGVYFVDVPGAKQSNIYIGAPAIPRSHPDYYPAYVANYKLGGSFNGYVNLVLREEKGYTYGARTSFNAQKHYGTFVASSAVRSTATLESAEIFRDLMKQYREGVSQGDIDFTKDALLKGNALRFETHRALLGMLGTMSEHGLPDDYIAREEDYVRKVTVDDVNATVQKYIDPMKMYYVVAGDAATQLKELKKLGFGEPVLIK